MVYRHYPRHGQLIYLDCMTCIVVCDKCIICVVNVTKLVDMYCMNDCIIVLIFPSYNLIPHYNIIVATTFTVNNISTAISALPPSAHTCR